MKKWQKALIGTALASSLVIGSGVGTYAWFSAEKTAKGAMENGTFSLGEMGQLFKHQGFAPSQLLFSDWQTIENTGNMDQLLRGTFSSKVNSSAANINKYKVGYIALKYKVKPNEEVLKAYKYRLEAVLDGTTNPINGFDLKSSEVELEYGVLSSDEVSAFAGKPTAKTITLGDGSKFWSLNNNEYIDIVFGVKLSEEAGNEFQGVQYDAEFKVEAKQSDNGAEY
jgi:spore coat-associated protein N